MNNGRVMERANENEESQISKEKESISGVKKQEKSRTDHQNSFMSQR